MITAQVPNIEYRNMWWTSLAQIQKTLVKVEEKDNEIEKLKHLYQLTSTETAISIYCYRSQK